MANYEMESVDLAVNIAAEASVTAQISDAQPLNVTFGQAAEINAEQAVMYIESGKAEIKPLVDAAEISASNAAESATSAAADADRAEAAAESVVSDKTFVFEQEIPRQIWTIQHNLGKNPSVTVVDSAGNRQFPDEEKYEDNVVIVKFVGSFAGKAFLN